MSARDFVGMDFNELISTYLNFYYISDEKCLTILRSKLGLSLWLYQRIFLWTRMCAHQSLSNLTIMDLEAILDGCLSIMDACMSRKMDLEGRSKKRRASLTSLSPDQFNDIVSSVFTEIYEDEVNTHNIVAARRSKRIKSKSENVVESKEL